MARIKLNDGKTFIENRFGKYEPNLCFIIGEKENVMRASYISMLYENEISVKFRKEICENYNMGNWDFFDSNVDKTLPPLDTSSKTDWLNVGKNVLPENFPFIEKDFSFFWDEISPKEFNLEDDKLSLSMIRGDFFVSKKGTNCFKISSEGKHILLRDDWGGAFVDTRGGTITNIKGSLYSRHAPSNGGGEGYDYAVVPSDWTNVIGIDDI